MEPLLEALTQYAEENLVLRYLREYTPQMQAARLRAEKLEKQLNTLALDAEELLEQLQDQLSIVQSCREQALFLSGISIGLELGRL